jgi:Protein of unknown function (DUF454)
MKRCAQCHGKLGFPRGLGRALRQVQDSVHNQRSHPLATVSSLRPPWQRPLYLALGCLCLVIGVVALVIPLIPGVVFLVLATVCFSRSSPATERWLRKREPRPSPVGVTMRAPLGANMWARQKFPRRKVRHELCHRQSWAAKKAPLEAGLRIRELTRYSTNSIRVSAWCGPCMTD